MRTVFLLIPIFLLLPLTTPCKANDFSEAYVFTSSYLENFSEYLEVSSPEIFTYIQEGPRQGIFYSEEEISLTKFMKRLKKEQVFLSKVIRYARSYSESSNASIVEISNKILNIYQQKLEINFKAQESFYYFSTKQFKPGLEEGEELSDRKSNLDFSLFNFEIHGLILNILRSPVDSRMLISCEENMMLLKQVEDVRAKTPPTLALGQIDELLTINQKHCEEGNRTGSRGEGLA